MKKEKKKKKKICKDLYGSQDGLAKSEKKLCLSHCALPIVLLSCEMVSFYFNFQKKDLTKLRIVVLSLSSSGTCHSLDS